MSFNARSLSRTGYVPVGSVTGTPNLNQAHKFIYATDDAAAVVETAGYFNNARGFLTSGSQIDATMAILAAGTPVLKSYVVLTAPAVGNVTIGLQTVAAG